MKNIFDTDLVDRNSPFIGTALHVGNGLRFTLWQFLGFHGS
jgi:hypothetical protein